MNIKTEMNIDCSDCINGKNICRHCIHALLPTTRKTHDTYYWKTKGFYDQYTTNDF